MNASAAASSKRKMLGDDSEVMNEYYEETKGGENIPTLPPVTSDNESVVTESVTNSALSPEYREDDENQKLRSEQLQFSIILAVCTSNHASY